MKDSGAAQPTPSDAGKLPVDAGTAPDASVPVLVPDAGLPHAMDAGSCIPRPATTAQNISMTAGTFSTQANLVEDRRGDLHLVYVDFNPSRVFYNKSVNGAFVPGNQVAFSGSKLTEAGGAVIALTPDDQIHITFFARDGGGRELYQVVAPASGGAFSAPQRLDDPALSGKDLYNGWMAADALGSLYATYLYVGLGEVHMRVKPLGAPWLPPERIHTGGLAADHFLLSRGGRLFWTYTANGPWLRIRDAAGVWGPAKALSASGYHARCALSALGELVVTWHENFGTAGEFEVLAKSSTDHGATFSAAVNLTNDPGLSRDAELTFDNGGDLHVLYQRFEVNGAAPDMWITSREGTTWKAPENLSKTLGRSVAFTSSLTPTCGGLNVVFADNTNLGGFEDVFFMRRSTVR